MSQNLVYLNGSIIPEQEAKISCLDPGFLYGQGLFETMRAYEGTIFKLDNHLIRLLSGLSLVHINSSYSFIKLKETVLSTLKANNLSNAYIRLNVWQGEDEVNVSIVVKEFYGYSQDIYKRGFRGKIVKYLQNENSLLCNIKSFNYLQFYLSRLEAEAEDADEAIFLNSKGYLSEGSRTNIFLVKDGDIITPPLESGCLAGITRQVVIDLVKKEMRKIYEKQVLLDELLKADEAFLTNSLLEIMPLVCVNNQAINTGLPGVITVSLLGSYRKLVDELKQR